MVNMNKFELVETLGLPALFTPNHILDSSISEGLYRYDLRFGEFPFEDGLCDSTIEKNVSDESTYAGSIILQCPLELGSKGFIQLDENSSPCFSGVEMTMEQFKKTSCFGELS